MTSHFNTNKIHIIIGRDNRLMCTTF